MSTRTFRRLGNCLLGAIVFAAGASTVLAYINGGTHRSSLDQTKRTLSAEGWSFRFGNGFPAANGSSPEFDRAVNQLVAQAAAREKPAAEIPIEVKREVARAARDALLKSATEKRPILVEGTAGAFDYRVGNVDYHNWVVAKERGRTRSYGTTAGRIPIVALRPRAEPAPAEAEIPRN